MEGEAVEKWKIDIKSIKDYPKTRNLLANHIK